MGQRLLIVDSDRTFLKESQVTLESAFEIEQLSSPDGVIAKLESGAFAAVLISVEISENKGYALCSALRKHPALADLKIILISSKATEEEYRRHQSLKGRADLYLHKPIGPGALVEALSTLVPARRVDPDNPLGDLADGDFGGEDWLSDLRSELDSVVEPVAPTIATQPLTYPSANQTIALSAGMIQSALAGTPVPEVPLQPAPPQQPDRTGELQVRLEELQTALAQRDGQVTRLEQDLQALQRAHDSVTQNLDDLARGQTDAQDLQRRLSETEQALKRFEDSSESGDALRTQLREGMKERHELLQQMDSTNSLLAEKTQKVIDLMKERDRHQQKALDDQMEMERLATLQQAFTDLQAKASALEAALEPAQAGAAMVPGLEAALSSAKRAEAEAQEGLGQAAANLEAATENASLLATEKGDLEARFQTLTEAFSETKARFEAKADEVAGLETTLRSQGRDLVGLNHEVATQGQDLKALQDRFDQQLQTLQEQEEALSAAQAGMQLAQAKVAELESNRSEELGRLESERADLVRRMNDELAAKDAEMEGRNRTLMDLQDTISRHEASLEAAGEAKSRLEAQLGQCQDRVQAMSNLFTELEGTLRKAAELAP